MKLCCRCKTEKPRTEFSGLKSAKDGLQKKCKPCANAQAAAYSAAHPAKRAAKSAAEYQAHKERYKERAAARYAAKTEQIKAKNAEYQRVNKDKKAEWCRQWASANPEAARAAFAKRKAAKIMATPAWASAERIRDVYKAAVRLTRELGQPFHVDHVVPLVSDVVCGLHCEANLQVLHGSENSKKRNFHWPEMP